MDKVEENNDKGDIIISMFDKLDEIDKKNILIHLSKIFNKSIDEIKKDDILIYLSNLFNECIMTRISGPFIYYGEKCNGKSKIKNLFKHIFENYHNSDL